MNCQKVLGHPVIPFAIPFLLLIALGVSWELWGNTPMLPADDSWTIEVHLSDEGRQPIPGGEIVHAANSGGPYTSITADDRGVALVIVRKGEFIGVGNYFLEVNPSQVSARYEVTLREPPTPNPIGTIDEILEDLEGK